MSLLKTSAIEDTLAKFYERLELKKGEISEENLIEFRSPYEVLRFRKRLSFSS